MSKATGPCLPAHRGEGWSGRCNGRLRVFGFRRSKEGRMTSLLSTMTSEGRICDAITIRHFNTYSKATMSQLPITCRLFELSSDSTIWRINNTSSSILKPRTSPSQSALLAEAFSTRETNDFFLGDSNPEFSWYRETTDTCCGTERGHTHPSRYIYPIKPITSPSSAGRCE